MANEKRLIDANALKVKGFADHDTGEAIVFVQDIDEAPTVDAVEVVRCKDCKHRYTMSSGKSFCRTNFPFGKKEDDFCSYGERKEG